MTTSENIYNSTVLMRQKYSGGSCFAKGFSAFLSIVFAIAEVVLLILHEDIFNRNSWFEKNSTLYFSVLIILLIADLAVLIINLIKLTNLKKTFICITEVGVFGCGSSKLSFKSKPFSLCYDQITKITYNDAIVIESGGETYLCDVRKKIDVVGILGLNLIKYFKNKGEYAWICNKCGSINRYSGNTCNLCGFVRKNINTSNKKETLIKDISLVMTKCKDREEFIDAMSLIGYSVNWDDSVREITYICSDGQCFSDKSLGDNNYLYSNMDNNFNK